MASYMSVERGSIQKAFALAHKLAETAERGHERKHFREIAKLIWQSCGEQKSMPAQLPQGFPGTEADHV